MSHRPNAGQAHLALIRISVTIDQCLKYTCLGLHPATKMITFFSTRFKMSHYLAFKLVGYHLYFLCLYSAYRADERMLVVH